MNMNEAIAVLDRSVKPGQDLPEELFVFISTATRLINVDLLIKDNRKRTLLTWRDDDFYGAGWHVPGGIIRYKEPALDRVQKVAQQELGCLVKTEPRPILVTETFSQERQRGHFVSMLYRCELLGEPASSLAEGRPATETRRMEVAQRPPFRLAACA